MLHWAEIPGARGRFPASNQSFARIPAQYAGVHDWTLCRIHKFNSRQHYWRHKGRLHLPGAAKRGRSSMTPQERQLVDDLFDRLSKMESAPRDPDATAAIAQGLRAAPNAVYALVQTVLVQDEALRRAEQPHPGTGGGRRARNRITPAGSSIRCAIPFSGKISRAARCRMCGLPKSAAVRSGTAAR